MANDSEQIDSGAAKAGPCTPYRHIGGEVCQHGYAPDRCPIRAAMSAHKAEEGKS